MGTLRWLTSPRFICGPACRRIDSRRALIATQTEIFGSDQYHWHAVVDAGDFNAIEQIHNVAGG
ncbi:hypothetical protein D3C81_2081460 [compost metagenome]